ncbi:hypothetical protein J6590_091970 [Homalodisca vitripennis]|nr:hypothetical protein J6590_091970 [Homalodisca vitripennis]
MSLLSTIHETCKSSSCEGRDSARSVSSSTFNYAHLANFDSVVFRDFSSSPRCASFVSNADFADFVLGKLVFYLQCVVDGCNRVSEESTGPNKRVIKKTGGRIEVLPCHLFEIILNITRYDEAL